jgi:hypothetical protein
MGFWLLLLLMLAAAFALLRLQRWRRTRPVTLPAQRTLFDLRTGDIVQLEGGDWVVEDRLVYDDDGFQWLEYLLRDGPAARWLVVCEDDWLEVSWLEDAPAGLAVRMEEAAVAFPRQIEWDGVVYVLREQGHAGVTASGRVMNRRLSGCRFGDYEGPDQRVLSVECWEGEAPEVTLGHRIDPASLVLLPGDGRSVYRSMAGQESGSA